MSTQRIKIGPYGGPGGEAFDISTPTALVSIQIWSNDVFYRGGGVINGISFTYKNDKGQTVSSGPWGSNTGEHHIINLDGDEHMNNVLGTTDGTYVTSLTFGTNKGRHLGPYGAQTKEGFATFTFPPDIVGFFGRFSDKLDAIGAYVIPPSA